MKRWIALAMLLVPFVATAADFWDGNAALQRGDADFESGLNILSNSFPPGTQITIQNQDTGKTVTATVTGRIEGQPDILLLMSPKTAAALGVSQGTLGRVRVTEPPRTDAAAAQPGNQTLSRDPDLNPAASPASAEPTQVAQAPKPDESAPTDQQPAATPASPSEETLPSATPAPAAAATPEAAPETPAEQPGATAPTATVEVAPSETNDDSAILAQAGSRSPQKEMFQPPREDQKFSYHPETTPPPAGTTTAPSATVASISEPGATPPAAAQADLPLADVAAPEESRPTEIVGTGTAVPAPAEAPQAALATPEVAPESQVATTQSPVQTDVSGPLALPPSASVASVALAPPEAPATATATPAVTPTAATPSTTTPSATQKPATTVATATTVPRTGVGTFYLQLAAYGSEKGARDLAAKLTPTYPALVLAPSTPGGSTYKVVIGPLNRAESGTLLTWFRYRGFPDAFLKQE